MKSGIKKVIGIVRGGSGEHYTSSLKKGGEIISYLLENLSDKYKPIDILIDKEDVWHLGGVPIVPANLVHKVDIVWNLSHPSISTTLDNFSIPNISVSSFSHTFENSKEMLREHMKKLGVQMPKQILSPKSAREVLEKFPAPWRVGDKLVKTFPELIKLIENNKSILVEEFIAGKVASIHSVPHFRNEEIYIFPPVNVFGSLSSGDREKLIILVKDLHHHLGAKHYLKSNFILNSRGKIYLLDFESVPNLKSFSHFSQACESVGAKMHHVVEHILEGAL